MVEEKSGSEMKLIIVLYIATSLVVGKPVEENSNTKGMSKMLFFMTKILCILYKRIVHNITMFIICEDDGNSNEHPPGYEYLADDYLMPSLDEEKGR